MTEDNRIASRRVWFIVGLIAAALGGCSRQEQPINKSQSNQPVEQAAISPLTAPPAGSAKPDDYSIPGQQPEAHAKDGASPSTKNQYYVMREGQKYGYEQGLSTIDKAQGVAAKPLTVIHYFGFQDNTYQVAFGNPRRVPIEIAECSKPCDFVKIRRIPPQSYSESPETIRAEKGTILWAFMQDAMNGKLERAFVMDKTYHHEGVQVGQIVPSTIEKHYFRAEGLEVLLIPESKLVTK